MRKVNESNLNDENHISSNVANNALPLHSPGDTVVLYVFFIIILNYHVKSAVYKTILLAEYSVVKHNAL